MRYIACQNAIVDNGRGQIGNQDFQNDAADGEQRGQYCILLVLCDI